MIYTVTFNPALDYIVRVEGMKAGQINRAAEEQILAGGKGINVSTVLNNLGYDNTALGFVAGFTGDMIEAMLEKAGCHTDFIHVDGGMSRINVKIKAEAETEINGIGPDIHEEHISRLFQKLGKLEKDDILILAGSIPKSISDSIYMDIMEALKEKEVRIVVDATGELLANVLKHRPFLVKPNKNELEEIFDVALRNKNEVEIYARKLKDMGARNVLVSMAGDGALLIDEYGDVHHSAAPRRALVNSVGAGDSMVAGFIVGYLEYGSYDMAFKMGVAAGSASAFSKYLADREGVQELMKQL